MIFKSVIFKSVIFETIIAVSGQPGVRFRRPYQCVAHEHHLYLPV
ncbi:MULTISPECIES: hypothetical protein [unclassified Streptomyces]|nr:MULTISPECIES: hypothetical protein [unclassified Streptomyces]MCX5047280.1 hypothetical protein [Streptomyces sp. NBC_00474]